MLNKKMYKETFSALHASEDTLKEVYEMLDRKKRRVYPKRMLAIAVVIAIALALGVTAYAVDLFGFRALLRADTVELDGEEYSEISLSQPQDVPEGLDPVIAEKAANSAAAWDEWMTWKKEYGYGSKCPQGFECEGAMYVTENDDGTVTARIEGPINTGTKTVTAEEYAEYVRWRDGLDTKYGDHDFNYDLHDAEEAAKLEEIAAKYGLTLRPAGQVLWSSETTGKSGAGFLTNRELAAKTAEAGCAGNVFYETPAGFDKLYWYGEGTFAIGYYVNSPSTGERINCYGYNSMYSTLSSGREVIDLETGIEGFAERTHTAPDGTEVTILSKDVDAYIYVYLENSFFAEHIYGAAGLTAADLDHIADCLNYSLIGR